MVLASLYSFKVYISARILLQSVYFKTILTEVVQLWRHYRRGKSFAQLLFSSFLRSLFLDNKVSWFTHHVRGHASTWRSSVWIACCGIHRRSPSCQLQGSINGTAVHNKETRVKRLRGRCGQISCFRITEPLCDTSADVIPQLCKPNGKSPDGAVWSLLFREENEELSRRVSG